MNGKQKRREKLNDIHIVVDNLGTGDLPQLHGEHDCTEAAHLLPKVTIHTM
jgi:hypothetical protein